MAGGNKKGPKGQKSITSFFTSKDPKSDHSASDAGSDIDVDEPSSPVAATKKKGERATGNKATGDASKKTARSDTTNNLPPIHEIPKIFDDIVSRIPNIQRVAQRVKGRKLRVATMCSGTESPLLALEMIQKSITKQYNVELGVEHVFSCEIEPFKQAYIERNFHPPLLFRDVCELGDIKAHTAYGSLATVPGNVDILVAGTSCVDYSNLNNQKQDIEADGESGRTFRGMMSWVVNHRPPIVILENVCSAPWGLVEEKFEKHGYSADSGRVDTKNYYIPHTRTRGYLIAIDKRNSSIPAKWKQMVLKELNRPASSSLDAFLLPSDDPRIHQARQKLVKENYNAVDRRTGRTDWSRCESRHQRARLEEGLGSKRPLTSWDESGRCGFLDFGWNDWGVGQVERVWDLMDISLLRDAKKGNDPSYKTQVWNLSQNVDRTIGSGRLGICPCLTPSMIPYITNRGGPMVGIEALSMQGLPVDKLLLTRETEDQLADLAGNAMSTTVVGTCIMAALVLAVDLLKTGDDTESYEQKSGNAIQVDEEDNAMVVDEPVDDTIPVKDRVVGVDQLDFNPLDLASASISSLAELLVNAEQSIRLCACEGRVDMTTRDLVRCVDCGHTSCTRCGGRPEHNNVAIDVVANPRSSPAEFAKQLKSSLPMCISMTAVDADMLEKLKESSGFNIPKARWESWVGAVVPASQSVLRFSELKRQELWSVVYRSPQATLELLLHPQQPEWRLYVLPEESAPANAEVRRVLESPVGRLRCEDSILSGRWEFALPFVESIPIKVQGQGPLVPSWESRLGLLDTFKDKVVFSSLKITVAKDDVPKLDRDFSGTYTLLDRCGTANGALHKREGSNDALPPLYMLFDPLRTSDVNDAFVFTTSTRRYQYGEYRPIVGRLSEEWRQSNIADEEEVQCRLPYQWVTSQDVNLQATEGQTARFGTPSTTLTFGSSNEACRSANALLVCEVPLGNNPGPEWPRGEWAEIDKIHERVTFKALAWMLERIRHVGDRFGAWQTIDLPLQAETCERCAPTQPQIQWVRKGGKTIPIEDSIEAGEYERRLKRRPSAFVTQLKYSDDHTGAVRVGVNIPSLLHRAVSRLPSKARTGEPTVSWRLNTNFVPAATANLPKFIISSNKLDKQHAQPPNFKLDLRKEQLRSLEWMLKQELKSADPFIEEEISEAILDPLGWRAEGRAQRPVHVRGGVLADQVGYGKTAITLGLIDCTTKIVAKEFSNIGSIKGKIPLKATLIVVPPHLTRQWNSEVKKFMKSELEVLVLSSVSNLNSATIQDFQDADIVVVASNLFKSNVYLENLQVLSACGDFPSKDGRHFNAQLERALSGLQDQTDRLQKEGSQAVLTAIQDGQKRVEEEAEALRVQTKRLKGKSYRDAVAKSRSEKKPRIDEDAVKPVKKAATVQGRAKPTRAGTIPEVVLISRRSSTSSVASTTLPPPSSNDERDDEEDDEVMSEPIGPRPRRSAGRKPIIVSDGEQDSDSDVPVPVKGKRAANGKGKAKAKAQSLKSGEPKKKTKSVDDDDFMVVDDSSESSEEDNDSDAKSSMSEHSSDEDSTSSKVKPKPKALKRKPTKAPASAASSSDMEVDDAPAKPAKKGVKRKASDDESDQSPKKRQRVTDPWKLASKPVQKDWTQMHAPPLEMFHFARKVVDEYTYLDGKVHALVTRLTAQRHWVLSGTPPIHDFGALKTISAFLNIHLGVDDDGEGQSADVKKRRREQTDVEKFHSFREVHTLEWHAHRHQLGQTFLDRFVRQNIAEIDEIPWTEEVVDVVLHAAERAIYLELEHHLQSLDMTIKRGKKTESDREKRLAKSLGDSKTAEEALLKCCSHFDLETSDAENPMKACDVIVADRERQLEECKANILDGIKEGMKREDSLRKKYNVSAQSLFHEWILQCRAGEVEDGDQAAILVALLEKAGVGNIKKNVNKEDSLSEAGKAAVWEHREKTHELRRLTKELCGRVRSARFFSVVRDIQRHQDEPYTASCPNCDRSDIPIEQLAVLSACGHVGCLDCMEACIDREECVYASGGGCKSAARKLNLIKADSLGVDEPERDGKGRHFGTKLEKVVQIIKEKIPKDERALIFVQFPDLMKKVTEALTHNKVKFLEIKGTAHQKSKNLEIFQQGGEERVLLLNVMDESASGANLTSANHAIFLSPLLAPSAEIYKANETQAVGRVVRFGQEKHVKIWRLKTENTIDADIFAQRKKDLSMAT